MWLHNPWYRNRIIISLKSSRMSICTALGVIGWLYCKSGCRASEVASFLAFHPPSPFYNITYDEETDTYSVAFSKDLPDVSYGNTKATILETKTKTKVPVLSLIYPGATYTIIYSHGNATDIGAMFVMFAMMALSLKVNVVGYDYTGYGASMKNNVRPTERQTYKDIETVYNWCVETKLVADPAKEVILYGQSVGSGPSVYLASRRPVAGLILHSPILSGLRVIMKSRVLCCCDIFPNISRIPSVAAPVFVIHGKEDKEVPFEHGEGLHNAVRVEYQYEPWWVPNRGHNDVLHNNEREFFRRMNKFIEHLEKKKQAAVETAVSVSVGESKQDDAV